MPVILYAYSRGITSSREIQWCCEANVIKKHQVIIDAQAFGEGQEHHTLKPVLESVEARFKKLGE